MNIKELIETLQTYPIETEVGLRVEAEDRWGDPIIIHSDTQVVTEKDGFVYINGEE